MNTSNEDIFSYHVDNLRRVETALTQVARKVKLAIKQEDQTALKTFKPLYILLCGVWSETRFKKLIYESSVDDQFRQEVNSERTQLEKWYTLVKKSFKKHYNIPSRNEITKQSLPFSAFTKYEEINEILEDRLKPIIELRNNLAHGEWEYPLNSVGDDVVGEKYRLINRDNYLNFHFRYKILTHLCDIIHDLVVSKPTFERDFDKNHDLMLNTVRHMDEMDYSDWANDLKKRYQKGMRKKRENLSN